ncbi:MAG: hypothetical protein H6625_11400 [Bdellovibrionaceae bacterium]|nr:hypothetical protein [Pseudobdellovibrionaceae bacterium]
MKFSLIIISLLVMLPSFSFAEFYEKDQAYIYKIRPYTEVLTEEELVVFTAKLSHVALVSVLESMVEHKVFPESIANIDDINRLRRANDDVEALVIYLNRLIEEQRKEKGKFSLPDLMPDAFMITLGKKLSLSVGAALSGSLSLGVVLMPVFVEKYSQKTGELVDDYFNVRMGIVGITNGDAGVGMGGGSALRIGLGAIWDLNDSFVNPEQFWGAGVGASWSPIVLGAGLNAKVGFLSNWDMPGWLDFAYISAAVEVGANIEVSTPRVNFTSVFSGAKLMAMLESSQKKLMEASFKDLGKKLDTLFTEINKQNEEIANLKNELKKKNEEKELVKP